MKSEDEVRQRIKEWNVDIVKMERNKLVDPDLNRGMIYAATMVKEELKWVIDE